jgi:hypothetical protein
VTKILLLHDYTVSLQRIYDNETIVVTAHDTFKVTQSVSGKFANRNNAAILTAEKYNPAIGKK